MIDKEDERKIKLQLLNELHGVLSKHAMDSIYPKTEEVVADVDEEEEEDSDSDTARLKSLLGR